MTKEDWIKIRKQPSFTVTVWYDYYKEKGGTIDDLSTFQQTFSHMVNESPGVVNTKDGVKLVNPTTANNRLRSHYDTLYNIDD